MATSLLVRSVLTIETRYVNTVTEEEQFTPPPDFKGGILADQMGLGKTLSIIALITTDQDKDKSLMQWRMNETVKSTLIVVRAPREFTTCRTPLGIILNSSCSNSRMGCAAKRVSSLDNGSSNVDSRCSHVHAGRLRWRRHHGNKDRLRLLSELDAVDIVLTTYQTLVSEFRKHDNGSPQLAYQVKWRRIVLDEGEFAKDSYDRPILMIDLAHDIRDYNRATAKAMRRLDAVSRWAVTGTPIQNNLSDIASLYQFLQIEPYTDEPTLVRQHIKQLFEERNGPEAVSKTRRLIRCIMLRRSLRVVELPEREELVYRLNFSLEEAEVYNQAKIRTGALLDGLGGDVSTFHILSWINSLRMICNLGTHAKLPKHHYEPTDSIWDASVAQEMFNTLMTTGAAICSSCSTDLATVATVATEVADRVSDISTESQLSSCSYIICGPCIEKQKGIQQCCVHSPAHEMQPVSTLLSSSSREDDQVFMATSMPTKVKALLLDLEQHVKDEKW